jgi:hypothetical protein
VIGGMNEGKDPDNLMTSCESYSFKENKWTERCSLNKARATGNVIVSLVYIYDIGLVYFC